jgi:hypothetical protein
MESESKKAIAVHYSTQSAFHTAAREHAIIYSLRQRKIIPPHRKEYSRTGAHGVFTWYLLPGRYFLSRQDVSGSGKHHCYNAWLLVEEDGAKEERTDEIPDFIGELACDCLKPIMPAE